MNMKSITSSVITLRDADKNLKISCRSRMAELYNEAVPEALKERVNNELERIIKWDHSSRYMLASTLADYCRYMEIPYMVKDGAANSVVAYLLRITPVNPLTPDICEISSYEDDTKSYMELPAFDLSLTGGDTPFSMAVSNEAARESVIEYLDKLYDRDRVLYVGKTGKNNSNLRTDQVLILAKDASVDDVFSLDFFGEPWYDPAPSGGRTVTTESGRLMTVEEPWPFGSDSYALFKIECDPVLDYLQQLEQKAGIKAPVAPADGSDLSYIFREGIYQELPVLSNFPLDFAERINHCSFAELVKYLSIRRFKEYTRKELYSLSQQELELLPLHREEVMTMLCHHGVEQRTALDIANVVSFEKVEPFPTDDDFAEMEEMGIDHKTVLWLKRRNRLHDASDDAELAYRLLQIVWFRKYRPNIFLYSRSMT